MSMRSKTPLAPLLIASNILAIACGGGGGGNEPPPDNMTTTVAKTAVASGDAQSGTVGQPLASPLRVVVTDGGLPAPGVTVNWSTTSSTGVMTPAGPTDADGVASSGWTLGTVSGAQTAQATVASASGSPVTFSATALAAAAATLAKAAGTNGDNQTGETNSQLPLPVQARVTDGFGNAVAGTGVNWAATGATVSAATVPSDPTGLSQVTVLVGGTAGPITITAESGTLAGSPLTFNATAVVSTPPPTSIGITVGNDFFRSNRNMSVSPTVDTVAVGGTVTWTWATGAALHSVTSNGSPSFQSSATQSAPASHAFLFNVAGTYRYYCTVHATSTAVVGMVGRIVVK
jgi:plastocyanin